MFSRNSTTVDVSLKSLFTVTIPFSLFCVCIRNSETRDETAQKKRKFEEWAFIFKKHTTMY